MNISVKETTVFAVFHPDAQALYNTCSDLKKVAWQLADPSIRLHEDVSPRRGQLHTQPDLDSDPHRRRSKSS